MTMTCIECRVIGYCRYCCLMCMPLRNDNFWARIEIDLPHAHQMTLQKPNNPVDYRNWFLQTSQTLAKCGICYHDSVYSSVCTISCRLVEPLPSYGDLTVFGRPFVKRFALCYRSVVCLSCPVLSVTFVHCGQMVGRIKMKLGMPPPQFSAHFYCGQTAGWMKLVLGMMVGLSAGEFVLDGDPAPVPKKGGGGALSPILRVEVRISKLDRKSGALP